jgi:hypothetical protein
MGHPFPGWNGKRMVQKGDGIEVENDHCGLQFIAPAVFGRNGRRLNRTVVILVIAFLTFDYLKSSLPETPAKRGDTAFYACRPFTTTWVGRGVVSGLSF